MPTRQKTHTAKTRPIKKAYSKTDIVKTIAATTQLDKGQVSQVLDELNSIINAHLQQGAVGYFTFPSLLKIQTVQKPAVKAREGINPFTGRKTTFKSKDAHATVKIKALKGLKDMLDGENLN